MAHILEKLNGDVKELQYQININRADLDKGLSLEKSKSELEELRRQKFYFNPTEFISKSFLFLVHKDGDEGIRPLAQNSGNSLSLSISQGNSITNVFKQGKTNTISCTVRNGGDLHVPIANVEILISKPKEYIFEGKIEVVRKLSESILVYAKQIKGKLKVGDSVKILKDDYAIHTVVEEVEDIRLKLPFQTRLSRYPYVKLKVFGSLQTSINVGDILVNDDDDIHVNSTPYKFRIDDVFTIVGRGTVVTGVVLEGSIIVGSTLYYKDDSGAEIPVSIRSIEKSKQLNITIAKAGETVGLLVHVGSTKLKKGSRLTQTPSNAHNAVLKNISAPSDIKDYDCIDIITTAISGHDTVTVTKELTNIEAGNIHRFIAARVYSTIPVDLPNNFDLIDPVVERHTAARMFKFE